MSIFLSDIPFVFLLINICLFFDCSVLDLQIVSQNDKIWYDHPSYDNISFLFPTFPLTAHSHGSLSRMASDLLLFSKLIGVAAQLFLSVCFCTEKYSHHSSILNILFLFSWFTFLFWWNIYCSSFLRMDTWKTETFCFWA